MTATDDGNTADNERLPRQLRGARCGDGVTRTDLEAGQAGFESCDDGNDMNIDACQHNCIAARCGERDPPHRHFRRTRRL